MKALRIIGAGGHGRVLADIASAMGYSDIAFLDATYPDFARSGVWDVIGTLTDLDESEYALGVWRQPDPNGPFGGYYLRSRNLIHPSAIVSPHATIRTGSVICAGAVRRPVCHTWTGLYCQHRRQCRS